MQVRTLPPLPGQGCALQLDLWFWHGSGPSREWPGYFFSVMPERPARRLSPLQQWLVDLLPE